MKSGSKNDKSLGANVASGLSERMKMSDSPDSLGLCHVNDRTNKPKGGTVEHAKGTRR